MQALKHTQDEVTQNAGQRWSRAKHVTLRPELAENITAYLFLTPSLLIVALFGLFPVAFAFFVSLHRWRRLPSDFEGLDSYYEALGNVAFIVFFGFALAACAFAGWRVWQLRARLRYEPLLLLLSVPATFTALTLLAFANWFFNLLPIILQIPTQLRGQPLGSGAFIDAFIRSFGSTELITEANTLLMWATLAVISLAVVMIVVRGLAHLDVFAILTASALAFSVGVLLLRLTFAEIQVVIADSQATGAVIPVWAHVVFISLGVGLLAAAYLTWQAAVRQPNDRRFFLQGLAALLLVVGGYVLLTQLPLALSTADHRVLQSLNVTVMYAAFSIPFQLLFGLAIALLLFQKIRFRSLFRVMFFLPYVMPAVATSAIFAIIFSNRPTAAANQVLRLVGIEAQDWLMEPRGIFELLFGSAVPDWLVGPSLALTAIVLFNIWTYAGFAAVIFLAGLGNIPRVLYEAARIDGASGWQLFRFVTLPLLSPTIFFQVLIATIGTFQAFTQIWLMRQPGAFAAVDTVTITIFQQVRSAHPDYAYGSALAFVLFFIILTLTLMQNRWLGRRVFYG